VKIETSFDSSKKQIKVRVSDNGVGLPAIDSRRVFEPFFTSKSEGLGMGLAISRSIVEAHGGRLWAEPDAIRGASFSFLLPIQQGVPDVKHTSSRHGGG
jgi:signal transduction histidine kinase